MSDEIEYPNEVQKFYYNDLKWCGCYDPVSALIFMRRVLQQIHDRSEDNRRPDATMTWEEHVVLLEALLSGELGLSYWYMIDSLGLTEHGGSIKGGWLSPEGEGVLRLLSAHDIEDMMNEPF